MKVKYISKTDIECESTNFHSKRIKRLLPHLSSKNLANISGMAKENSGYAGSLMAVRSSRRCYQQVC